VLKPYASLSPAAALAAVKLVHTVVWAVFVSCILAIPVLGWYSEFGWSAVFMGVVGVEALVLILNGWKCPLTAIASRYTDDRRDNFDIYLPEWLARYNKLIFGALYAAGMLITALQWAHALR
jgi:polyferredoxin